MCVCVCVPTSSPVVLVERSLVDNSSLLKIDLACRWEGLIWWAGLVEGEGLGLMVVLVEAKETFGTDDPAWAKKAFTSYNL